MSVRFATVRGHDAVYRKIGMVCANPQVNANDIQFPGLIRRPYWWKSVFRSNSPLAEEYYSAQSRAQPVGNRTRP